MAFSSWIGRIWAEDRVRATRHGAVTGGCKAPVAFLALLCALMVWGASTARAEAPIRLLALGDSLVAGFGLAEEQAFPARLEAALRAEGHDVAVLNGGVSGDTTAGGLARLDWALADRPDAVLLELGANDALRGIDPADTRANLMAILDRLDTEGVPVLIAGMRAPLNLDETYRTAFESIFPDLARRSGALLYPFFLEGVAANPTLNQADGIHPTAEGVDIIVRKIAPYVVDLLGRVSPP